MKKNEIFSKKDWKKLHYAVILIVLFAQFVVCGAEKTGSVSAKVSLADPETEELLAKNREKLAMLESEIARLKVENVRLGTENTQKQQEILRLTTENAQKRDERNVLEQKIVRLESSLESTVKTSQAEVSELKTASRLELARQTAEFEQKQDQLRAAQQAALAEADRERLRLKTELSRALEAVKAEKSRLESGFDGERKMAAEENSVLRKELFETLNKYSALLKKWNGLERSAASVLETLSPAYLSTRETELVDTLRLVQETGIKLTGKSTAAADLVLACLPQMKLNSVETAKLRVAMEDLSAAAGNFARLHLPPGDPESFQSCRILELNEKLGVAVLAAGYRDGIRVNMTLRALGEPVIPLKVIAVRPFVAAVIPLTGGLAGLTEGMEVRAAVHSIEDKKEQIIVK